MIACLTLHWFHLPFSILEHFIYILAPEPGLVAGGSSRQL